MAKNGFISLSILENLSDRADKLYKKFGFGTKSGYIQDRLRRAIEADEEKDGRDGNGRNQR